MVAQAFLMAERPLRETLKLETRSFHDRLDEKLGTLATGGLDDYGRFLAASYAARSAVEAAMRLNAPGAITPPATSGLLEKDLVELGLPLPAPLAVAAPNVEEALGMAWALGGSALGNRALLARRRKMGLGGPTNFLSDRKGAEFFASLLPSLERPIALSATRQAVKGATTVFNIFLLATLRLKLDRAA